LKSCTELDIVTRSAEPETLPTIVSEAAAETMFAAAFTGTGQCGGPETILLVEDEAFVRKVTAEVLESAGYKLVIARTAAEALAAYRGCQGPPDLLLADVVMPGMSGRELAGKLAGFYPRARALLMSGYPEQLTRSELVPHSQHYLAKPFSIPLLLRKVREVLNQPVDALN
jgi:two-component system cell cycle sensor histidine kinase/response regulator CckA